MNLLDDLKKSAEKHPSPFAAQLLKEDIARLENLYALRIKDLTFDDFKKHAKMLGWTQGDLRTFELDPELGTFLDLVYSASSNDAIRTAWANLNKRRMDLLVGCLSRPRID